MVGEGPSDSSGALAIAFAFHGMTQLNCLCFPSDPGDRSSCHSTALYRAPTMSRALPLRKFPAMQGAQAGNG